MLKQSDFLWFKIFYLMVVLLFITHGINCFQEKKIMVVIPSYNNQEWYERNLDSVLKQDYSNYRVLYTDDVSSDSTADFVAAYKEKYDVSNKITLIRNKKRQGALYNLYRMIHTCDDDAIVVTLDGDDWLADNQVFNRLNEIYTTGEVWLTYGQFQMYPHKEIGWATAMPKHVIENNSFREYEHLPTHLRTFYAWLFKRIKLKDFLYNGTFFIMSWDVAMMFPMIEMAGERHRFIADIMYIYNDANNISDHRISRQLQAHLSQVIRNKKPYKRLVKRPITETNNKQVADIVIFSDNSAQQLERLIEEIKKEVIGSDEINVLYRGNVEEIKKYNKLQNQYPAIQFFKINYYGTNFCSLLNQIYKKIKNNYIFFMEDRNEIIDCINLKQCIRLLEQTQAYGFYFKLSRQRDFTTLSPQFSLIEVDSDIYAWNFAIAHHIWSRANTLDMVLYRKNKNFLKFIQCNGDLTLQRFESIWANEGLLNKVGLCYGKSRVAKYKRDNNNLPDKK